MGNDFDKELDILEFLKRDGKSRTGVSKNSPKSRPIKYKSIPKKQRYVNNRIMATSEKRQVLVKVIYSKTAKKDGSGSRSKSSYRQGMASVKRLSEYLEKDAATNFEMKDGNEFEFASELDKHIKDEWSPDFTTRKNGSDIMHLVVSTPSGSDRDATLRAAREFGKEFFEVNDYAFVRHDDTHNPHVHFLVKIKGDDGSRLNLGKKDLELARETFAHHAREQGIDVAASRRSWRASDKHFLRRDRKGGDQLMSSSDYYKSKDGGDRSWVDSYNSSLESEIEEFNKIADVFEGQGDDSANILAKRIRAHSKKLEDAIQSKPNEHGRRLKEGKVDDEIKR